ncbi:hypothetical protein [Sorangium sp. So ce1151]|uniref:hypothetical protein n=1 Tax=Sorangium sp. So ce1151 TaxID=3133332 RepID=UPI003F5ED00C
MGALFSRGGATPSNVLAGPPLPFPGVSAGLQLGLSELFRLDMRPLELTAAMHLRLSGPGSLADAWLRGQRPFESARGADQGKDLGLGEPSAALGLAPVRDP